MMFPGQDPVSRRLAEIGHEFNHGMALKLDRILDALAQLDDPHKRLPPVFHVAGTNGKGSTCAFLRALIEAAGMKAHVFTSPHLVVPNERVRLAGKLVDDAAFIAAIDRVANTGVTLTYFEAMAAAAFVLFADTPADALVLEVGLGGRFDATNVIERPAVAVIAPIDLDHTAILGPTVRAIAGEKAGIIKPGAPVVVARQTPEAMDVVEAEAARARAPLLRCGSEWDCWAANGAMLFQTQDRLLDLPTPSLVGRHQIDNAGLAIAAMLAWKDTGADAIARGVTSATWPARMQRLVDGPLAAIAAAHGCDLWLDGGHNPHGARAIADLLQDMKRRASRPVALVCGMLTTKDAGGFIAPLSPHADAFIAVPIPSSSAAYAPDALAAAARDAGLPAESAGTLHDGVARGCALAPGGLILICGSLHLAGDVLAEAGGVA